VLSIPPGLDRVVRHSSRKGPLARFQSARDLAFALEALLPLTGSSPAAKITRRPGLKKFLPALLIGLALVAATGAGWLLRSRTAEGPLPQNSHAQRLTDSSFQEFQQSPDGRSVAFTAGVAGRRQIFVRLIAGGTPLQITATRPITSFPLVADASSIVYFSPAGAGGMAGHYFRDRSAGGVPRRITSSLGGERRCQARGRAARVFEAGRGEDQLCDSSRWTPPASLWSRSSPSDVSTCFTLVARREVDCSAARTAPGLTSSSCRRLEGSRDGLPTTTT
jgi:hypothetical protein